MLTLLLLLVFGIGYGFYLAQSKLKIVSHEPIPGDRHGNTQLKIRYAPIVIAVVGILVILFQPYSVKKIEAGYQGLLVNLVGDNRGASSIKEVSGWKLYNTITEEIYQIPLDQRSIRYGKQMAIAKGGFPCDIYPSFNYSVKRANSADMFTNLRSSFRSGGLEAVEQGWLEIAIIGAVTDVANKWVIDDIFNNRTAFEAAIMQETNKRVGKWFQVSQLRANIQPPGSIVESIKAKAKAVQDAITSESQAKAATADAQRKIALAKGDSATVVIEAASVAKAMKLKKAELTPIYIEYLKWVDVNPDVPRVPSTVLGRENSTMVNLK